VGVGAPIGCPFYPAELEIELLATTPALYSTEALNSAGDRKFPEKTKSSSETVEKALQMNSGIFL